MKTGIFTISNTNKTKFQLLNKANCYLLKGIYGAVGGNYLPVINEAGEAYVPSLRLLKGWFSLLQQQAKSLNNLHFVAVQVLGTGYKIYSPKVLNYKKVVLRMGFGGADLAFDIWPGLRVRARRQKALIIGQDLVKVTSYAKSLLNLKAPDAYKGKGLRYRGQAIPLKKRKAQQRGR